MRCVLYFISVLALACSSGNGSLEVAPTELTKVAQETRTGYTFIHYIAKQPAFRDRASGDYVEQRVYVAVPDGVGTDAPVLFRLVKRPRSMSFSLRTRACTLVGL